MTTDGFKIQSSQLIRYRERQTTSCSSSTVNRVNGKFTATCLPPPTRPRRTDADTPRSTRIRMLPRTERIDEFRLAFRTETAFTAVETETGSSVKTQILLRRPMR